MGLNSKDVWGHFAPMFHLVDAFAIFAITLVGGCHAILPTFNAQNALITIGERYTPILYMHTVHACTDIPYTFTPYILYMHIVKVCSIGRMCVDSAHARL